MSTGPHQKPVKCGAHSKRTHEPCKQWAVPGSRVCVYHGAGKPKQGRPGGRPIKHGAYSVRFKMLAKEGAERLAELQADQEILDLLRMVAASQYVLEGHAPIDPTEEMVKAYAKARVSGGMEPTEAEKDAARLLLAESALRMIESHGKLQAAAHKQQAEADLVLEVVAPVMRSFAERILAIVEDEVGKPVADRVRLRFGEAQAAAVGQLTGPIR